MKRVDQNALHRVSTGNSYKAHDERAGFVSYDNRDSAEKAISQMNGYQVGDFSLVFTFDWESLEFGIGECLLKEGGFFDSSDS